MMPPHVPPAVSAGLSAANAEPAAANPAPPVVPALQRWTGGTGRLTLDAGLRVVVPSADETALRRVAAQLSADLQEITGWPAPVVVTDAPTDGDVVLDIDPVAEVGPDTEVAMREGYRLEVSSSGVRVVSRAPAGAFWGTRSLLQMLRRETPGEATMPVGTAVDWPNYAVRGFMLDVGRRWFGHEFLRDYVRYMSWFKLNTFQLHLSDNEFRAPGGDWSKAYSAFRLATDNPRFAGLAATDGAFTRADWDRLETVAADHFLTIVPEIDAPAHARAFIAFDPRLGLNGGNSDHLDLTRPAATEFMKQVCEEFAPWFKGPTIHIGADEYPQEYEPDYRRYFNEIAAHVRGLGKQVAAWGSFSVMAGSADGYDRGVTINSWNNRWYSGPQAVADGYTMINTNDELLYIVPFAHYYHGRGLDGRWLYDNWQPHVFADSRNVAPGEPLLRGAMSAVWNDLVGTAYDAEDVHGLVEPTFGLLGHKMWRGPVPGLEYSDFMARVSGLGVGPGRERLRTSLSDAGDPRLGVAVENPLPLAGGESTTLTVTVTNRSSATLTMVTPALRPAADGLSAYLATTGASDLEPGRSTQWTWTVSADRSVSAGTTPLTVEVAAEHTGVELWSRNRTSVRTVLPAPEGQRHLSFTATSTASSVELGLDRLAARHVNDGDPATGGHPATPTTSGYSSSWPNRPRSTPCAFSGRRRVPRRTASRFPVTP